MCIVKYSIIKHKKFKNSGSFYFESSQPLKEGLPAYKIRKEKKKKELKKTFTKELDLHKILKIDDDNSPNLTIDSCNYLKTLSYNFTLVHWRDVALSIVTL